MERPWVIRRHLRCCARRDHSVKPIRAADVRTGERVIQSLLPAPAKALSADQVAMLLAAAEGKTLYPFFVLAVATGMRRGEIGALSWDSVDFDRAVVNVPQAVGEDRLAIAS